MMRIVLFAAVLLLVGQLSSGSAVAGEDVFVVPRVTVQAQADSATAAKTAAIAQGRRRAMDLLLRRLTAEEDWASLPTLASGQQGARVSVSETELVRLESGFEVYSEKSSPKTYRAFITYRFKPDSIRNLLKTAGIPYSEAQTRTALVLPVLQTDNGLYLWEENNPWMAAWKVRPYDNELTPMRAPLGDLEDQSALSPRQALALDATGMSTLAQRYNVSQVIVAHARLRQASGQDRLTVRLINGYRESGALDGSSDLGDVFGAASAPEATSGPVSGARVGDVLAEATYNQASGNFPTLAENSIEQTIAKHAAAWKNKTLINHSTNSILQTTAFFSSVNEWTKIRGALVETPLVGSVQVRAMSRTGAEMLVNAYGDPGKLVVAMEAQGLALWSPNGENWLISTPETARVVSERLRDRRYRRRFGAGQSNTEGVYPTSMDEYLPTRDKTDAF
ncbi:MAG: DUF2066 domain-containing protein [Pseudomonadota bacterium]